MLIFVIMGGQWMDGFFGGNRQTTLRMDRHETIVAERYETFRYYCIVGVLG